MKSIAQLSESGCELQCRAVPSVLVDAVAECCPHCQHDKLSRWGHASGLQRWKCQHCNKTFNILTGTPLGRLRNKEKWPDYTTALIDGRTVRKSAKDCGIHRNTSFRWRHRFLEYPQRAQCKDLAGIAEGDITLFLRSRKGVCRPDRKARKRGRDGIGKGLSNKDYIAVITLRDRNGKGADRVAPCRPSVYAEDLFRVHLRTDTLLLTDGGGDLCSAAQKVPNAHMKLVGKKATRGKGEKGPAFHLQTNNGFHGHLKNWMTKFNGVSTKYLANYIGWHRHHHEKTHQDDPDRFIQLAINPLAVHQQLTMT